MSFGIATALLKYNSESDDRARQSKIISTSYLLVLIFSLLSLILFSLFYKSISNLLGVSPVFFYLTAVYAFLSNFYILTTFTLRSLHKNKEFSFFQAFYGFISLAVLLFFLSISSISFYGAVFASYAAYFLVSIIIFIILRKYITFSFEKIWAVKVLSYGWYTTIATIASAITLNLDKVIINKYFTSGEVGLYGVYYNSSYF
jgi:O-antigen/teichoic acid export membrane protein